MKLLVLAALAAAAAVPLPARTPRTWARDPAWHDGLAEKCVYEATRTVYGVPRAYLATAYTNKERVDPETTAKAEGERGFEAFKHHWSERVPTERYDYDYSTMVYLRADDLSAYKLTAATQDDCGASFKELVREGRDELAWRESVYFPGGGARAGSLRRASAVGLADALTLALRDYDFEGRPVLELELVPSQKDVHRVPFEPVRRRVRHLGREALDLPVGRVDAHALALETPEGEVEARYWFAADGGAPMLHALVRYEGPQGITYRLASHERTAYWKR